MPVDSARAESLDALAVNVFVLVKDDHALSDIDLFARIGGKEEGWKSSMNSR